MMIEVNLMPAEMQRVEHTPLPRFLVIMIGTAVIMATGAFGVVVNLRRLPDLNDRLAVVTDDVRKSELAASVHDTLLDEIAETQDRKKAIAELWRSRISWSEKLAQLSEMTPEFIGFRMMKFAETRGNKKDELNGGMLTVESISAGDDHSRVAAFRRILKGEIRAKARDPWVGRKFFNSSFLALLPTGTKKIEAKEYVEKVALEFEIKMPVKTAAVRMAEAVKEVQEQLKEKRAAERARKKGRTVKERSEKPAASKTPEETTSEDDADGKGVGANATPAVTPAVTPATGTQTKMLPREISTQGGLRHLQQIRRQVDAMKKATRQKKTEVITEKEDTE